MSGKKEKKETPINKQEENLPKMSNPLYLMCPSLIVIQRFIFNFYLNVLHSHFDSILKISYPPPDVQLAFYILLYKYDCIKGGYIKNSTLLMASGFFFLISMSTSKMGKSPRRSQTMRRNKRTQIIKSQKLEAKIVNVYNYYNKAVVVYVSYLLSSQSPKRCVICKEEKDLRKRTKLIANYLGYFFPPFVLGHRERKNKRITGYRSACNDEHFSHLYK